MNLYELFIEPWMLGQWMQRGVLAAMLASVPCALIGVFLYLRRLSLVADALSHTALPGIVIAFLLSGSLSSPVLLLGALLSGGVTTAAIEYVSRSKLVRSDAAIGIVFSSLFAVGVILLSVFVKDAHIDTQCMLFGDVLGISDESLWTLAMVSPSVLIGVLVGWRALVLTSFDADFARTLGWPVSSMHYMLMGAVALVTVAAFEAIGAILAIAMLIVPAATAHLLADRMRGMILWALLHACSSSLLGMYAAVWFDVSAAGAIVLVEGALYLVAVLFAPAHGILQKFFRTRAIRRVKAAS